MSRISPLSLGLMLSPALGLLGVFIVLPMVLTLWLSFTSWSPQTPFGSATWVGLRNYSDLFSDLSIGRDFRRAFLNTALYTVFSMAILLPLSVGLGLLVYQRKAPGGTFLRSVLFSTYMVPMVAIALVFSKLYSPTDGPLNQILSWLSLPPSKWLSAPQSALGALVVLNIWQQMGYFTVLVVAGLTQIPKSLYEAAHIDGASATRSFFGITLPLLRNTLLFCAVIALINAVQVFEPVALITQGGPAGSTNVLTFHIRRVGIERAEGGLGSAMAVMLMLALIASVALLFALARRKDNA